MVLVRKTTRNSGEFGKNRELDGVFMVSLIFGVFGVFRVVYGRFHEKDYLKIVWEGFKLSNELKSTRIKDFRVLGFEWFWFKLDQFGFILGFLV